MTRTDRPTHAVLDADIISYRAALQAEETDPTSIPYLVEKALEHWLPIDIDHFSMAFSCNRKENFRRKLWPNYKKNRESKPTPEFLGDVRQYIKDIYDFEEYPAIEADDIMGIYAEDKIAVTIDKDLRGVEGWHLNPFKEDEPIYVTKEEAEEFFLIQWMSGDSTDCIPGLWRIGPKRAKSFLKKWGEVPRQDKIIELYSDDRYRPRDTCDLEDYELALSMARCVKILDKSSYDINTGEISLWEPKGGA